MLVFMHLELPLLESITFAEVLRHFRREAGTWKNCQINTAHEPLFRGSHDAMSFLKTLNSSDDETKVSGKPTLNAPVKIRMLCTVLECF